MICRFITGDKNPIDYPDCTGMNALRWASLVGHCEVMKILLEREELMLMLRVETIAMLSRLLLKVSQQIRIVSTVLLCSWRANSV